MTKTLWTDVDDYLAKHYVPEDSALEAAMKASAAADLPDISITPNQGKLLQVLTKLSGASRVLEIGTLGAYSTIWIGRALAPDGEIVTLEVDPNHAEVARKNIERAGLSNVVDLREGLAIDTLPKLHKEGASRFDFAFIDADKENIPEYFEWSVRLVRPGGIIVVDNVIREGEVANAESDDERVHGCRRLNEMLATDNRVCAAVVQTVGSKGYDGFVIASVLSHQ